MSLNEEDFIKKAEAMYDMKNQKDIPAVVWFVKRLSNFEFIGVKIMIGDQINVQNFLDNTCCQCGIDTTEKNPRREDGKNTLS
jgi:hypothetical protein